MDAKLTTEQAKRTLGWIRIQCDSQLKKEIDRIITLMESLAREAALGRAAVKDHSEWANMMCPSDGKFKMRDDECCEYEDKDCGCQWYNTCRTKAEKEAAV